MPRLTVKVIFVLFTADVSSAASASYLPAAAMTTYPLTDPEFASHQPESKVRLMLGLFSNHDSRLIFV